MYHRHAIQNFYEMTFTLKKIVHVVFITGFIYKNLVMRKNSISMKVRLRSSYT